MIEVDPLSLLGTLGAEDDPVVQTFTIHSVGAMDLNIDEIEFAGRVWASLLSQTPVLSFYCGSFSRNRWFASTGANQQVAQAIVHSDDPQSPLVPVNLIEKVHPELQIFPIH